MDIFLVRHGEAASSWSESSDPGLSATGVRQARDVAALLRPQISANTQLLSSPLRRAIETAEPLAIMLGKAVHEDSAFREIPSPVPLAQRQDWLRQVMNERWSEQESRVLTWRTAILQQLLALQSPTVVFTHFLVINSVVGHVLGSAATLCFWPANASITRLRLNGTNLELVEFGEELITPVN
jgi:broad specificity phosphatase PhoE